MMHAPQQAWSGKPENIAAMAHKYAIGQPFAYPRNDLTYAGNFLHMMFSEPYQDFVAAPEIANHMPCWQAMRARR